MVFVSTASRHAVYSPPGPPPTIASSHAVWARTVARSNSNAGTSSASTALGIPRPGKFVARPGSEDQATAVPATQVAA